MKKITLLKSLLVAAGLLVGTSASWAAKSVVGSLDNSADWWSAFSDYYTLAANESQTITFTNYSSKGLTYHNWVLVVANDVDRGGGGYSEYLVLRADGHKWGDAAATGTYTCSEGIGMPCDNAAGTDAGHIGYTTLMDILDGSNVVLKVSRSGATVTIRADFTTSSGTSYYQQEVITAGDGTQNIRFFLTTEKGHIENLYNGAWNCIETRDFDDAETFKTGFGAAKGLDWAGDWSNGTGTSVAPTQIDHGTGKAMYCTGNTKRTTDVYYQLSNSSFTSAVGWKVEMDFAFQASSNTGSNELCFYNSYTYGNHNSGRMTGKTNYFMLEQPTNNTTITLYKGSDKTNAVATTLTGDSYKTSAAVSLANWYHLIVKGIPNDGMYVEIHNANGETVIAATKVNDYVIPGGFNIALGRNYGRVALDNLKLYTMIQPVVTTKYQLSNGTTLIDAVETVVTTGNSFTPSYPASFQSGTKQYTYVSGGDQIASVTADQTATIVYSENDMPTGTFYAETYEKNGGTTGWTTSTGGRYTPAILSDGTNKYLSVKQNETYNNGATVTGTAWSGSVDKSTDFTMSFDLVIDAANQGTSPLTFFDKDNSKAMLKLQATANDGQTWKINDNADQTVELTWNVWYRLTYSRKGSLTYLTITKVSAASSVLAQTQIATLSDDGGLGKVTFVTDRYYANIALDNVLIRAWQTGDTPEVTETTYTIKYQDGSGNTLKDDVVNPTTVGTEDIVATTGEMASFFNDGHTKKYIYVSGNDPITAVADANSNVITLVFREAATWSYTVTNNLGTQIASSYNFEGETIYVPYSAYELKDGVLYSKGTTGSEYRYTFTLTEDNQEETITGYTASNIGGVVAFTEGENISDAVEYTGGNTVTRASNAKAATRGEADRTIFTGITPGKYQIYLAYMKPTSTGISSTFGIDGQEIVISVTDGTNVVTAQSAEFTVSETSNLTWTAGDAPLDWIYIKCTSVPVEVTFAGYATYVNTDYDLDFSEPSIEAYKVKVSTKGKATLTKVDNVPVGTPVLLYKEGGATEAIPVMTGAAAVTDNDLVAGTGAAVATTDGDNTNMILNVVDEKIGFYFANNQTVATNRAYLHFATSLAPEAQAGARMAMVFGDEGTTAISGIKNSELSIDNSVYNLNGQKVMQPTKGLYIVNGKKVIVK